MARQVPIGRTRDLAVVLHDITWLLPRTIDPSADTGLDRLPASELEVMRLLVRNPGLSVGEVAQELGLQPSNASAVVRSLITRGLLKRREDRRDARVARLVPTSRAQEFRRRREAAWGERLRARLKHVPPEDVAVLLGAVESLRALAATLGAGERAA